ncbi:MAG: WD40 repeat domain-containing protein, partial [Candidatus Hydrogenedentes bacterium]|nr:WD40 repeat domain-containing protein [Candidatus Hydrogenedentota bacterium]
TPAKPVQPAISAMAYAQIGEELVLAQGSLHSVQLLGVDAGTGETTPKAMLEGHSEMVRALAFSPDGALLAAGGGKPGRSGEIKIWRVTDNTPVHTIEGHTDNILGLAFSPDGKRLVSASYDRSLIVWDVEAGTALHTLANHVDAVYTVAWSPDGKRIASGAGDRTVKLWNADNGTLLATISDSLDAVLTLAFSPDGKSLAGAGADKVIRIWEVGIGDAPLEQSGATAGTLKASSFAHEGAVLRILYAPDGVALYSTGEDKRIKVWDAARLTEKLAYEPQSDWVTALALNPKGNLLAAGRYDASTTIYAADSGKPLSGALADGTQIAAATGPKKVTSLSVEAVIIRATVPPAVQSISPDRWHRGAEIELTVSGKNLERAEPIVNNPKIVVEVMEVEALPEPDLKLGEGPRGTGADILDNARPYKIKLKMKTGQDAPLGRYELLFRTPMGVSNGAGFTIIPAPDAGEVEPNEQQAQTVQWPGVVIGAINASGDVDRFAVHATAGQELVFAITDSGLASDLKLVDGAGTVLAMNSKTDKTNRDRLGHRFQSDGDYVIEVADADLRANIGYRLHIGQFPMVSSFTPLGIHAGAPQKVSLTGFNLPATELEVDPPDEARTGTTISLPIAVPEGSPVSIPSIAVTALPEFDEVEPNNSAAEAQPLPFPSVINARIEKVDGPDADFYHFAATKDQTIFIETVAAKLGSPVDSTIEVLDSNGNSLQRAVLRCVAKTALTLSPRDSRSGGLRLENWRDLKLRDYVMAGGEVIKVSRIPGYGDEDVLFEQYPNGQRVGYFGTTPEHHAVYDHIYKVTVHPVGSTFAPNGMPVYPIFWRNDDGFTATGDSTGDSALQFVAPGDGDYIVRVSDVRNVGGPQHAYRLMLRALEPDFDVSAGPYYVNIAPGSRVPVDVRVVRKDGFNEPVNVNIHGLPEGFIAETESILPDEDLVRIAIVAAPGAKSTAMDARFIISAESTVNGQPVKKETAIGPITVSEKQPDLIVNNGEKVLALAPGELGAISVTLTRANGFNSRSPISVLNLPVGVRVMYTGLNGILVREGETGRRIEILAEPWVTPMTRKIYIQANIETQTPLKPVFIGEAIELRIAEPQKVAKS